MIRAVPRVAALMFIIAVVFLAARGCGQESFWERMLAGPFKGKVYSGEIKTAPIDTIMITSELTMEVFFEGATNDPIVRLRQSSGTSVWARVLVPKLEGSDEPQGRITSLQLNRVKTSPEGITVFILVDWTAGGTEGGVIRLGRDYSFQSFGLSW